MSRHRRACVAAAAAARCQHRPRPAEPRSDWPSPWPIAGLLLVQFVSAIVGCPEACVCPPSSNQVTCASAGLTAVPRGLPPTLTTLDLSGNRLHSLSAIGLAALRNVVNLKLNRNRIETVHDGALVALQSLQTLELSANRLTSLSPFTFRGASANLLHLDLSSNNISRLEGAFRGMRQLSRLDLSRNELTEIGQETFADLVNLRYLLLAENRISRVDRRTFRGLAKLTYLVLKGNPIGRVARFQFNSLYLSYVDLSECGLRSVPRGLPNSIRYLQLRRNNISAVGEHSFHDCPYVSILVLDDNGLTEVGGRAFVHMTYLQQLWLNNNQLRRLPGQLPAGLQRLLADQNRIGELQADAFPTGSRLHTLSLMGNEISRLHPAALHAVPLLQSLDLSNNRLRHIYPHTFVNCTRLETLQLSKNPLEYVHVAALAGLRALQTLSLAYIPTVVSLDAGAFADVGTLSELDLDSSRWLVAAVVSTDQLLAGLSTVEQLSMRGAGLTTLRRDFFAFFPRLRVFRISSARWHCDRALIPLRDWLLTTEVKVAERDHLTCLTPHELHGRAITTLADHEFAPLTTPLHSTPLPTAPGPLSTPAATAGRPTSAADGTATGSSATQTTAALPALPTTRGSEDGRQPALDLDDLFEEMYANKDKNKNGNSQPGFPGFSSRYPTWEELMRQATRMPPGWPAPSVTVAPYDTSDLQHGDHLQIRPLPDSGPPRTLQPGNSPPGKAGEDSSSSSSSKTTPSASSSKKTIIIIVATTISTVVIAGALIAVIVYLSRKNRDRAKRKPKPKPKPKVRSETGKYQNGIKYKTRNDVLYFMPKQTDGSTSQGSGGGEGMTLVPGRDINHEGPLRVYKWEDF